MDQAILIFASRGIDGATYDDIAEACGITRPLVQHYFPDREAFILMVMRYIRARFQKHCVDAILAKKTPVDQLLAYFDATLEWIETDASHAKTWLLFYYYCGIKKKYRILNTELVNQGQERITALIAEGVKAGDFAPEKGNSELRTRAKLVQNLITSTLLSELTEASSSELLGIRELSRTLCLRIARGK